jgi:hypothetical protein
MQKNEIVQFAGMWAQAWEQSGSVISPGAVEMAFEALEDYNLQDIRRALTVHMRDPERGRFAPKVADVMAVLGAVDPNAWPSPDEAWGIAVRTFDEADTCIVCDEIMTARESCEPVMNLGDEVGARMTFRDVFDRQRRAAIANGRKPKWWMTPGTDRNLRAQRLAEAVALKRLPPSVLIGLEAPPTEHPVVAMRRIAADKDGAVKVQAEEAIAKLDAIREALKVSLQQDAEAAAARRQAERDQAEARRETVVSNALQKLARNDAAA